jgi:hypothetical protein
MMRTRKMAYVAVMALGLLLLAGPAHAAGWPLPFAPATALEHALHWWQGLWAPGAHPGTAPAAQPSSRTEKSGSASSPAPASTTTTPACQGDCERGGGIDPNG